MVQLRVARILWFALTFSTVLFLLVLLVLKQTPPGPPPPFMPLMLSVAAVISLVASVVIPRLGIRQAAARMTLESKEETITDPLRPESDVLPYRETATVTRKVAVKPEKARRQVFAAYQTALILGMALSESVALFGFVLKFLGFPWTHALPFFIACWISMALRFPTLEKAIGPFERATGVHIPRA